MENRGTNASSSSQNENCGNNASTVTIQKRLEDIGIYYTTTNTSNFDFQNNINNAAFVNDKISSTNSYEFNSNQKNIEENVYDPYDYGSTKNSVSFWGSSFHLYFMSAGITLLNIPFIFLNVGYITGFVTVILIVYFYAYNIRTLIQSEYEICKLKRVPNVSYSELVHDAFKIGPAGIQWFASYGKYLSHIVFISVWFCKGCYGFIMVCQILQTAYNNVFDQNVDIHVFLYIMFLPTLLVCLIPKLNYLVPSSLLGSFMHTFVYLIVIYYALINPSPWHFENKFGAIQNIPLLIGSVLINLNVTGIIIPLKNDMKKPRKFNSKFGVLSLTYTAVAVLFAVFSLLCCLRYGTNLQANVMKNLPKDNYLAQAAPILAVVTLYFQSPLVIYVIVDVIWNNIFKEMKQTVLHPLLWESALRTSLMVLGFVTILLVPNISVFQSFSGTVCTSIDSLILPAVVETLISWKINRSKRKFRRILFKNILIILLAIILLVTGITNVLQELSQNTGIN